MQCHKKNIDLETKCVPFELGDTMQALQKNICISTDQYKNINLNSKSVKIPTVHMKTKTYYSYILCKQQGSYSETGLWG